MVALRSSKGVAQAVRLLEKDAAASYGAWENVLVVHGARPPDLENVRLYKTLMGNLLKQHPAGIGMITVIQGTATPRPEARDALVTAFQALGNRLTASFVIESKGFASAAQRAIITAILLGTGRSDRMKVSGSVADGVAWLSDRLGLGSGPGSTAFVFERAVREFSEAQMLARR